MRGTAGTRQKPVSVLSFLRVYSMSPSLTISLVGVAITLAAILVQLGRVLQRADQNESARKELKEQREKELKPQTDVFAIVRQRTHARAGRSRQVYWRHLPRWAVALRRLTAQVVARGVTAGDGRHFRVTGLGLDALWSRRPGLAEQTF